MKVQSLNGIWQYQIGNGRVTERTVPFSAHPVGRSVCMRTFDLTHVSEKVFLRFEGITYHATVTLNGVQVGEMLPYCRYTFDVTSCVKSCDNVLSVVLEDITPTFGPSEGWENYGGIIHDVLLLYRANNYIEDVFFTGKLQNNYRDAQVQVQVQTNQVNADELAVTLRAGDETVLRYTQKTGKACASHLVENVRLWSPEDPQLYQLEVALLRDGAVIDDYECEVGFREFTCDAHHFYLNGQKCFIKGVCKHEMFGESGHTPTLEQVEYDLRMIKASGCNYVRLVHYPHDASVLRLADRIGLMVSEEPGLWWSDTANEEVFNGSVEVLRRTILRDRNHACIAFWLCFNECKFTERFLVASAKMCKETDPTRLVSGANCMSEEDTLIYFNRCAFDFYTMHPYAYSTDRLVSAVKHLNDKPLLFTEWGGHMVYNNPKLLREFISTMINFARNEHTDTLAGACFWCWAEMNEFGRGRPACVDGILAEGLVTKDRTPTEIYDVYCDAWRQMEHPVAAENLYEYTGSLWQPKKPLPCNMRCEEAFDTAMRLAAEPIPRYLLNKRLRHLTVGPQLQKEEVAGMYKKPLVLADGTELHFACDGQATTSLTMLGAVSMPKGYPIAGEYGEQAAELIVHYTDGGAQVFPLCNGVDFTTAMMTFGPSRIDPQAENATRFATFSYEKNHENYVINRLELPLPCNRALQSIQLRSLNKGYCLLVYGLFI